MPPLSSPTQPINHMIAIFSLFTRVFEHIFLHSLPQNGPQLSYQSIHTSSFSSTAFFSSTNEKMYFLQALIGKKSHGWWAIRCFKEMPFARQGSRVHVWLLTGWKDTSIVGNDKRWRSKGNDWFSSSRRRYTTPRVHFSLTTFADRWFLILEKIKVEKKLYNC